MLFATNITWNARIFERSLWRENRLLFIESDTLEENEMETTEEYTDPRVKTLEGMVEDSDNIKWLRETEKRRIEQLLNNDKAITQDEAISSRPYRTNEQGIAEADAILDQASDILSVNIQEEYATSNESDRTMIVAKAKEIKGLQREAEDSRKILEVMQLWLSCKIAPNDLVTKSRELQNQLHDPDVQNMHDLELVTNIIKTESGKKLQGKQWGKLTDTEKFDIVDTINVEHKVINGFCGSVQRQLQRKKGEIKEIWTEFQKYQKPKEIFGGETSNILSEAKAIVAQMGFVSPLEVWNGSKIWWEEVKKSFKQKSDVRSAGVAGRVGKVGANTLGHIFGEFKDVGDLLEQRVNSENKKIRDEYLEFYKNDGPTFIKLFDKGGIWDKAKASGDVQRQMAIMFYAAENGWLYGINTGGISSPMAGKIVLTELVTDEKEAANFYEQLQTMNQNGAKQMEETMYNRVKPFENWKSLQTEFKKMLKENNLPGAIGIAKRVNEKGLNGTVNMRVLVSFYEALEDPTIGPMLRNSIDVTWLNRLGTANIADASVGFGFLKQDRHDVMKVAQRSDQLGIEHAGVSGKAIALARKKITAANPELKKLSNKDKLNELVAKLLVGETLEINGKHLTVWNQDFYFYRQSTSMQQLNANNHTKDTDFDLSREISTQMMRSEKIYDSILRTGSDGSFDEGLRDQANAFLEKILKEQKNREHMYSNDKITKDEYNEFMIHVGGNISQWYRKQIADGRRPGFIEIKNPLNPNESLGAALYKQKLINPKDIVEVYVSTQNKDGVKNFMVELGTTIDEFTETHGYTAYRKELEARKAGKTPEDEESEAQKLDKIKKQVDSRLSLLDQKMADYGDKIDKNVQDTFKTRITEVTEEVNNMKPTTEQESDIEKVITTVSTTKNELDVLIDKVDKAIVEANKQNNETVKNSQLNAIAKGIADDMKEMLERMPKKNKT